jgi:hypothetical protein
MQVNILGGMKMKRSQILFLTMVFLVPLTIAVPAMGDGAVVLHPGYISGSVSVTGQNITYVTINAVDVNGEFSSSISVWSGVSEGNSIIDYTLTVEGDHDYYVIAQAQVAVIDPNISRNVLIPMAGPVHVPVYVNPGDEAPLDMSMEPAIISGTIATATDSNNLTTATDSSNLIQYFGVYTSIYVPEFKQSFTNYTSSSFSPPKPGVPGVDYTLLVAPGIDYYLYANVSIDGIQYSPYANITAPAAGQTLTQDFTIDVTAATISGTAILEGMDVTSVYINGNSYSPPPTKWSYGQVNDISSGAYTLDVTGGSWNVYPEFYFNLPGVMTGLSGSMRPPARQVPDINNGDHVQNIDFLIDPGFITGKLNLIGPKTDFSYGGIQAYSNDGGYASSPIKVPTGEYMFVASPGDWQHYTFNLSFYYPPDSNLSSYMYQYDYNTANLRTVTSGQTVSDANLSFNTITVKLLYSVQGGGTLSSPYYEATITDTRAYAYGSYQETAEGHVIGTLLLPGTYSINAFATVQGSRTEFGTFNVTVEGGDVVVIGGTGRPIIKVSGPTDNAVVSTASVTVNGTATDDVGVASITINDENVPFSSTGNANDPNEVSFSHDVDLPIVGQNTITITVADIDGTEPVTLTLTITRNVPTSEPPIAEAGPDQMVYAWIDGKAAVTLDGSDSNDPAGRTLTYNWTWAIDSNNYNADGVNPTVVLPVGKHTIQLVVNNGLMDSVPDDVNITVIAPLESKLEIMPCVINRDGRNCYKPGNIIAFIRLPEGIAKNDIDSNAPLTLYPGGIEASWQLVIPQGNCKNRKHLVGILAFFDKDAVLDAVATDGRVELTVVGSLKAGQYFYGNDTVTIMSPKQKPKPPWCIKR